MISVLIFTNIAPLKASPYADKIDNDNNIESIGGFSFSVINTYYLDISDTYVRADIIWDFSQGGVRFNSGDYCDYYIENSCVEDDFYLHYPLDAQFYETTSCEKTNENWMRNSAVQRILVQGTVCSAEDSCEYCCEESV